MFHFPLLLTLGSCSFPDKQRSGDRERRCYGNAAKYSISAGKPFSVRLNMVSLWCVLALLTFLFPEASGTNPGVKVRLTEKGLEYGRQIGLIALQKKLKEIKIPDISGSKKVHLVGKVSYSLKGMKIVNLGLPKSAVGLVPGTGVSLSISDAYINLHGNWRVKYMKIIKDHGSFDVSVSRLSISATIGVKDDGAGRPMVSCAACKASVGHVRVKFHGGASWLYNLFKSSVDKALRKTLQKQICSLVCEAIQEMNPHLKTLNVLAQVDKYAEIEYSMVESPLICNSSIDLSLKGEFYNIGHHTEPPFSPAPFSLPPQDSNMLYMALSAFTLNSAGFVYDNAGVLGLYVTDDMIPSSFPFRLNTKTFGTFIPEIAKQYPGLMMKLLVKPVKEPHVSFKPNNVMMEANSTITAYAIQPNATLTPLFILNVNTSVSAQIYITGLNVAGVLSLNEMDLTLGKSFVGPFQVKTLGNVLTLVLKGVVIPAVNAYLKQGYPLPAIGKMNLVNTQLQILKDYVLIGTDVQFTE
ncbi:bactericidal permeability-increasing protein-like isoform 1-T2 [Clarias gariepinus]|uniref:bactericidal permeability-increasing protein-like n=1 Tax=Clarias gariepinus TaxID=13013 RepID=UPI00234CF913|nr:bactericidal permeability-increasing protein-like [Clarias gariepinus]XP_053339622.1 bactericidal permeability-increasing protein-like [Clarias gariepinus]